MCCGRPMCWSRAATSGLAMGRFIRLAAIYRLTPANGLPLVLSAQWLTAHLPSRTAFHQLPLAMAIYRLFGHLLTHKRRPLRLSADSLPTARAFHRMPLAMPVYRLFRHLLIYGFNSLALQPAGNGHYRIANLPFRVRSDPVIRLDDWLYRSFSAFLLDTMLSWWCDEERVRHKLVVFALIGHADPRCVRLLRTDGLMEDQGIAVDFRDDRGDLNAAHANDYRNVIVSGFRNNETIAAHLCVWSVEIDFYTTEPSAADRSHPLAQRYPVSVGAVRRLLRPLGLESNVIDGGRVLG
ncbi:unnamed protein product [Vitrella brassicaformis CCMP3155]|uniref:Uncharacterized protein n=1 Tax=Vitrella brassicaformis (strain CCMP3155) TaxID=1169540 RepID=A0A0G4GZL1_VITBC|nr:unnamed protein product [Vitrella brassicaformis CCMP3155]|eukprot:CEM36470.1 unnamed protein product [Vitrella brassicaformis CCMP3155]